MARALHTVIAASFGETTTELPADQNNPRDAVLACASHAAVALTRDQAMDLLWPGLDPAGAARNLRVTMTHLRRLLEPGRTDGEASYCLRSDGDGIRLVRGGLLTADLWSFQEIGEDLDAAVALWRGDPLPDLAGVCEAEIARIRSRHGARPAGAGRTPPRHRRSGRGPPPRRTRAGAGTVRTARAPAGARGRSARTKST